MLTIMRGRRAGTPSSCCPLRVDHHVDHQVIIIIIIIMIIIIFMIILVISTFFFRVLFIFIFLMFMVMIVSGEDVIAWDHVGVQVQEKIGSWCSIYSLCQEQRRTFHTLENTPHTPPPRPSPIPQQVMWANSRMLQVSGLPRCEGDMRDAREIELQVKAFPSCKWDVCLALSRTSQRLLSQFGRMHFWTYIYIHIYICMYVCTDMTSHFPPSPLRVCWYAAFPLRWLGTLLKPAYFVTRGFTAAFYIYINVCT